MSYMHIKNLYQSQEILLFKECFAMEKIHGTAAHLQWKDGKIIFFSGGSKFEEFVKLFNEEDLTSKFNEYGTENVVIYGEAYGGKCQGMSATYGNKLKFVVFEVKINNMWLPVPVAEKVALKFGLEFVHYVCIPTTLEEIDKQRDEYSVQAYRNLGLKDKIREGIVLRPTIEVTKNNGERIIAKHKRDEFRETKSPRVTTDRFKVIMDAEEIANEWVTEKRLEHILQDIPYVGIEQTGEIILKMIEDVMREGEGEIIDSKEARKSIGRVTVSLFKQHLNKRIREIN